MKPFAIRLSGSTLKDVVRLAKEFVAEAEGDPAQGSLPLARGSLPLAQVDTVYVPPAPPSRDELQKPAILALQQLFKAKGHPGLAEAFGTFQVATLAEVSTEQLAAFTAYCADKAPVL